MSYGNSEVSSRFGELGKSLVLRALGGGGGAGSGAGLEVAGLSSTDPVCVMQWAGWVLDEEESLKHFKAAYDMGINTWELVKAREGG